MSNEFKKLTCPYCQKTIDLEANVNSFLAEKTKKLQDQFEKDSQESKAKLEQEYKNRINDVDKQKMQLELEKNNYNQTLEIAIQKALLSQRSDFDKKNQENQKILENKIREENISYKNELEKKYKSDIEQMIIEFENKKNNEIAKAVIESANKVRAEVTEEMTLKIKVSNSTSNVIEGDNFEEYIFSKVNELFPQDQVFWNDKISSNADITHIFSDKNYDKQGTIIYEVKAGEFKLTPFVAKIKEDMQQHENVIQAIFITKQLPSIMAKDNLKLYIVPDTDGKIIILHFEYMFDFLPLIYQNAKERFSFDSYLQTNPNLTEEQKQAFKLITNHALRQAMIDLAANLGHLQVDMNKEKNDLIDVIEKRNKKQNDLFKKAISNSESIIATTKSLITNLEKE